MHLPASTPSAPALTCIRRPELRRPGCWACLRHCMRPRGGRPAGLLATTVAGCAVVAGWWLKLEYSAKLFAMWVAPPRLAASTCEAPPPDAAGLAGRSS